MQVGEKMPSKKEHTHREDRSEGKDQNNGCLGGYAYQGQPFRKDRKREGEESPKIQPSASPCLAGCP